MMDHYIALIMAKKVTRCRKAFVDMPVLWEEAAKEGVDDIFEELFDGRLPLQKARFKLGQKIGMGTERWQHIGMIRKSMITEIHRKYKPLGVTISPELSTILERFKLYGGKKSQLVQSALEKVIEEIGDEPEDLYDFVNTWHGHLWRKNIEKAEFKRKLEKYHLSGLENKEGIHDLIDKFDREDEIKLKRKLRDAKKKIKEIEGNE